ncbi:uncharacterized protein [Diadema setosum]|uniref:uncharacterized protein n=1 Tax=Diadema setosum TaxID=31175 RepID=UPI003B3AC39A
MAKKGPRFPSLSDDELSRNVSYRGKHSKNTQDLIKHSVNILALYAKERDTTLAEIEQKDPAELCEFLRRFYAEARRANGDAYAVSSMISLRYGLTRHFQNVKSINIANDKRFQPANDMHRAVMRRLRAEGKGLMRRKDPIHKEDMIKIRKSSALDVSTPRGLQNKVFIDVLLYNFCDCGRDNLREMKKSDFHLAVDSSSRRYIYFKKCKKGKYEHDRDDGGEVSELAAVQSSSARMTRMYENEYAVGGCPVKSFCTYLSRLDPACLYFWQRPKTTFHPDLVHWYEGVPLGKNNLGMMMVRISTEAKCSHKYTNHCLRATSVASLNAADFDGRRYAMTSSACHRRPKSLPRSSGVAEEQKRQMSLLISALEQTNNRPTSCIRNAPSVSAPVVTVDTLLCSTSAATSQHQQEASGPVLDASGIKQEFDGAEESSGRADFLDGQDDVQLYSVKMEDSEDEIPQVLPGSEDSKDDTAGDTRENRLSSMDGTLPQPGGDETSLPPASGDELQGTTAAVLGQTKSPVGEVPQQILHTGQEFNDYEDFRAAVELYESQELCKLSTDNCRTVESANKLLQENSVPVAEKFKYSYIQLRCKQHRSSKGCPTKEGSIQSTRSNRCPMNVRASVDRCKDKLVIMHGCFYHHRDITCEDFTSHPKNREDNGKENQKSESCGFAAPNHQTPGKVIQHDVHSLKSSLSSDHRGPILDAINKIINDDPTSTINLVLGADSEVSVLYLQTVQMLRSLHKFPEVIMCDVTCNVNQNKMPLYTFFVVDGNGKSIPCAHVLVADQKEETLRHVFRLLKESGGDTLQSAGLFLVNANFAEVTAVKKIFPQAKVHLCMSQVLQTFKKATQALPTSSIDSVRKILQEMVYTKSKGEYEELHEELERHATVDFKSYFNGQWHVCRCMWVPAFYGGSQHFGNRTVKRLEGLYQSLKTVITPSTTITECFKGLISLHGQLLKDASQQRAPTGTASRLVQESKHPEVAKAILTECTSYAAEKMLKELCRSCECKVISAPQLRTSQASRERDIVATVVEDGASYMVSGGSDGTESCSCHFSSSMGLPCRHIFCSRDHLNMPLYGKSMVPDRWKQNYQLDKAVEENGSNAPTDADMSKEEKENAALAVAKELATALSETNHRKFYTRLDQLKELVAFWEADKEVTIKEGVEDEPSKGIDAYFSLGREREPPDGQESMDTTTQTQSTIPAVSQQEESTEMPDAIAATSSGTVNCHKRKAKSDTPCSSKAVKVTEQVDDDNSSVEMLLKTMFTHLH